MKNVQSIEKTDLRRRPPDTSENFNMKMEVDYKSNIDFNKTWVKIKRRTDCKVRPIGASQSEAEYGIGIKSISAVKEASINISAEGIIQIFCKHQALDNCIKWIQEAVELLPGHKRLVLFPTKITYRINDTYKEKARPTEEVIERIAKAEDGPPIIFPIGWAHKFFVELDVNPLQGFFPRCQPLEAFVMKDEQKEESTIEYPAVSVRTEVEQSVDLQFPHSGVDATKYLGAGSPVIRLRSTMEDSSPKYEEYLTRTWLEMRSAPWQWFSSDSLKGKMIVRDLNIDKKARIWTLDLRKYSGSEVESVQ